MSGEVLGCNEPLMFTSYTNNDRIILNGIIMWGIVRIYLIHVRVLEQLLIFNLFVVNIIIFTIYYGEFGSIYLV